MAAAELLQSFEQIPGPPGHFIHGNTIEYRAGRIAFIERLIATYGNVVRYRIGCDWCYLLNDAPLARALFTEWEHPDNAFNSGFLYLRRSFLGAEGRDRIEPRRRVYGAMCPRRLLAQYPAMAQVVEATVDAWAHGQERNVLADLLRLGVDLVSLVVFGRPAAEYIAPVVDFLSDFEIITGAFVPVEEAERLALPRRRAAFIKLDEVVTEAVARWRAAPERPDCVLRQLIGGGGFDERALVHEVCVILLSNVTAPATAARALHTLAMHPEIRTRLEAQLDRAFDGQRPGARALAELPALDRVVKEVLRLYPPLGLIGRQVLRPWQWGALLLEPKSRVQVSPHLLHRDPAVWPRALSFEPERWAPRSPLHRAEALPNYMPFGYGIRRCIGDHLSLLQVKLIVATVLSRVRLEPRSGHELRVDLSPLGAMLPEGVEIPMIVGPRPRPRPRPRPLAVSPESC